MSSHFFIKSFFQVLIALPPPEPSSGCSSQAPTRASFTECSPEFYGTSIALEISKIERLDTQVTGGKLYITIVTIVTLV